MRDKKKIVIGVLCALVGIMAVGYAALATRLNITGTASIDSTWKVEITNIAEGNIIGDATSKETPSYTATTANFSVGLIQPTDSITYDIEVSNLGTLKAKVDSIQVVVDENDAIIYEMEGLVEGDKLGVGEKDTLSIKVTYNPEITSQPSVTAKDITVTINYVQDLGVDSGSDEPSVSYEAYSIGDQVNFAGSNWYVIKDSSAEEDYVTLLKEESVTSSELGEYETMFSCPAVGYPYYQTPCKEVGELIPTGGMQYYLGDTCNASDDSGCAGHNDYEGSKVREFLEGPYISTLGSENLKAVDGYKIRLITLDELQTNFGLSNEISVSWYEFNTGDIPTWLLSTNYWTMTADANNDAKTFYVSHGASKVFSSVINSSYAVRPVINLLKSSIEQ